MKFRYSEKAVFFLKGRELQLFAMTPGKYCNTEGADEINGTVFAFNY